jgi:hypothetical protein
MPAGGAPVRRRPATLAVLVFAAVERPRVEDLR